MKTAEDAEDGEEFLIFSIRFAFQERLLPSAAYSASSAVLVGS
jgi:hypothetical protein